MTTDAHGATGRRNRQRTALIRGFILRNLRTHPRDIASFAASHFGVTPRAINRHLGQLVDEGLLEASGQTRARTYSLESTDSFSFTLAVTPEAAEDVIWSERIRPHLEGVRENVVEIFEYGFTEMVNNVIDHSASDTLTVLFDRTPIDITIIVQDFGVGIFKKIASELRFNDEHHAILEIAKGKVTTDPDRHTGEGIFFTSRMFDRFGILSGTLYFGSRRAGDWLLDHDEDTPGTAVLLKIDLSSTTEIKRVFDEFASEADDYGFSKTSIPVHLLAHEGERLVSRSQAKRLLARTNRFTEVVLDFQGVEAVGQAFADEVFRVFAQRHPEIHLSVVHTSPEVEKMIARARSTATRK